MSDFEVAAVATILCGGLIVGVIVGINVLVVLALT